MKASSFSPLGENKRGNTNMWTMMGVGLAISVVFFVVIALLLGAFKTSSVVCESGYTFNSTANNCYLNTNNSVKATITTAGTVTDNGLTFSSNTMAQLPTAGTILGVSLLLIIIAGIGFGGYTAYKKYR